MAEDIGGKGGNAGYQHLCFYFPTMLLKGFFFWISKIGIPCEKVQLNVILLHVCSHFNQGLKLC